MKSKSFVENFGMPSAMGELMAAFLVMVDAWFEHSQEQWPRRFCSGDRVEVLGQLVRLASFRFSGFEQLPSSEDVALEVTSSGVSLRMRVASGTRDESVAAAIEHTLHDYGFKLDVIDGGDHQDILITCHNVPGGVVVPFPGAIAT